MKSCWQFNPKRRPTFKNLIEIQIPYLNSQFHQVSYFFNDLVHCENEESLNDGATDEYHEEDEREENLDSLHSSPNGQRSVLSCDGN